MWCLLLGHANHTKLFTERLLKTCLKFEFAFRSDQFAPVSISPPHCLPQLPLPCPSLTKSVSVLFRSLFPLDNKKAGALRVCSIDSARCHHYAPVLFVLSDNALDHGRYLTTLGFLILPIYCQDVVQDIDVLTAS